MNNKEIAELLEKLAKDTQDWHSIGSKLRVVEKETKDQSLVIFIYAFEYMFVEKSQSDYRERYGPFAPWIEMNDGVFPPPLKSLAEQDINPWLDVQKKVNNSFLVARLSDLLWERKVKPRPDLFAKQAIDAYLQLSHGNLNELEKAEYLIRALEIAKVINDRERIDNCILEIINSCDAELSQSEKKPGITLRLLEALAYLPNEEIPKKLDELLEKSFTNYINDPFITESVIELILKRVSEDNGEMSKRYLVNRWIEEGQKSAGIIKITHLEHALELARSFGFHELIDSIRVQIQNISESDLDLKELSVTTEIPVSEMEHFFSHFTDCISLEESLNKFGIYGPPSGHLNENNNLVDELSKEAPLQFLVTQQILDENNMPIKTGHGFDENRQLILVRQETTGIQVFATFSPDILKRLGEKFNFSNHEELTKFFITPIIPEEIAKNLANAFSFYFNDNFYTSALLLIPSLEAIFRNICRGIGLAVYQEPIGPKPGQTIGLGKIFESLQGKMDEDWRRYFYNSLCNPISLNYRNRICHGLLFSPKKSDVIVLLHIACNLRLMKLMPSPGKQ